MVTTVTSEGQITIPEDLRDKAGIKPGDQVEVSFSDWGYIVIKKPNPKRLSNDEYAKQLRALAERRLIRGATTDEIMEMTRGYSEDAVMKTEKP